MEEDRKRLQALDSKIMEKISSNPSALYLYYKEFLGSPDRGAYEMELLTLKLKYMGLREQLEKERRRAEAVKCLEGMRMAGKPLS